MNGRDATMITRSEWISASRAAIILIPPCSPPAVSCSALFFKRQAGANRTCLVLENHAIFGGEARRNEFLVDGQRLIAHQGSAMFFPPLPGTFLADFYQSIGIDRWQFPYQTWSGKDAEIPLGRTSYTEGGKNSGLY